ncbi:hypothetical protein AJ80_00818 [Polytolypa hystricis UAMH7299]|uniref:Ribosomal RNA-processing protein 14/surfeit locus protein 6 C-terminal domain-containing protein n=1 Tax=Polytolypa hystricis (strain UAMH7299) TaxID=1447883 RepID=A0A2B7Z0W8_POLH7|nr:hypothetical protein AJ80_00818 [Polytolypa hystricis UAMH7299]
MADSLEERLRSHAEAFDGLLSLIPAKYYYGEDNSDQWQKKKQTKEEARNAKLAKLTPDSSKTAKDVMDENARKRKRDENAPPESDDGELGSELPREGLARGQNKAKKQKKADDKKEAAAQEEINEARQRQKEKKAAKLEQKKLKAAEKLEKKKAARANKQAVDESQKKPTVDQTKPAKAVVTEENDEEDEDIAPVEGFAQENEASTAPSSPVSDSQVFDTSKPPSGTSSISSIAPPTDLSEKDPQQPSSPKSQKPTEEELKQRLQKRLDELRAARHADGFNGKPARNRQELIEARRQREEQRREHKKEMRQKAKEEEQRLRDEAIARRFSPHGSLLASPGSPAESISSITNNFSFGRVVFADGQQMDPNLSTILEKRKQKGPQDATTALKAIEAKEARLAGLDEEKRADIAEKDMWLNAKKKAHGERVKDDVSLLKKTLNRKTSAKKKSEREWTERTESVANSKYAKQKKREDNLRKRREEKGSKGKKGKGKSRPGFEGSFKAKAGGKKK